ncbi:carboxymuconolactone decarboxylase family protein [Stappia sp. MMSF_3263]|uniref:carboxymuconolactone decarboxylase family protein n=1 Tax=Stappia sp. MMSF_3263 TaxID=3046693 RepID=UPI00273FF714|nr:carboxymuconolactone decarboxylase family protein [Stappia sp. MMSF_3263]
MARIAHLTDSEASGQTADLFGAIRSKLGMVPNLYRTAGKRPAVLEAMLGLGETLGKGSFDTKTREAIALAVAGANSCDYCASAHSAISRSLKVDDAAIDAHLAGRAEDPRLAAILRLSLAIVETRGLVSDADIEQARRAGLDDGDIIETTANVVANILTNYLNHIAGTEIDFPARRARAA